MTTVEDFPKVVVVQTTIGDYRQQFINEIETRVGDRARFVCGREYFDPSTCTRVSSPIVRPLARNVFLAGRRLLWQRNVWSAVAYADVAVLELNPRILNTWALLLVRRLMRRPTILWGHAWSRSGRHSRTEPVRHVMRRLADAILVYTEPQQRSLQRRMPHQRIFVAPNAIYAAKDMRASTARDINRIVWMGRLVSGKKADLAIRGFAAALPQLPADTTLAVIGDGPLRPELERLSSRLGIAERIEFLGHVHDVERLTSLFETAIVSLSTGCVGLNLIHSLGFGVPMIYAVDEPHGPEIEAATTDNSRSIPSNDPAAVANALVDFCEKEGPSLARRAAIAGACSAKYSTEAMADGFMLAVREVSDASKQ
jgi:glycosyltransferase involved in cell wall biosynthesis